jgi:hypothetical protein
MQNDIRKTEHQKSAPLEDALRWGEELLGPLDAACIRDLRDDGHPIFLIVGCARSGTTLLLQYLSQTGLFCYPTNFLSRFYYAPYIGAKLQQMLIDYDTKGELWPMGHSELFSSKLGKTKGPLSPNEFWYFWRKFFCFNDECKLDAQALASVEGDTLVRQLTAIQQVFNKPFIAKGMICNWHIPFLATLSERIHFIFVTRDIDANCRSLLKARQEFFGKEDIWYSFKPPGYREIIGKSPLEQVQWQVEETNKAILEGLFLVPKNRQFQIQYEDFCENPSQVIDKLGEISRFPSALLPDKLPKIFTVSYG